MWADVNGGDRIKVGVVGGIDPQSYQAVRRAADGAGLFDGYNLVSVRFSEAELVRHND